MDELKPCPFCGGEAEVQLGKAGQASAFCDLFKVECLKCGVSQADWDAVRAEVIDAWNTRPPVTDEMVERAAKALEPFAKAAMGIKAFDPDFPLDGAALRASFDWYDKCQGKALKRNSVRLQDINFAAETHAAITAALGGPHG